MGRKYVSRRSLLSAGAITAVSFAGTGTLQQWRADSRPPGQCGGTPERVDVAADEVDAADEKGNHWLAFAWSKHERGLGRYESTLTVPCTPATRNGHVVFFYFPAFQSYSGPGEDRNGYILQPVLAWNWSGSKRWEMATWCGSAKHGFKHSDLIPVSPGDELRAVISRPDEYPGKWYLEMRNKTTGEVTVSHSHELGQLFRYTYLTLEANRPYDPGNCGLLPEGVEFSNVRLEGWHGGELSPTWHRRRDETFDCDIGVDVRGPKRVAVGPDAPSTPATQSFAARSGLSSWLPW